MRTYILRRMLQAGLVGLAVSFITFIFLHLATDPALLLLPPEATKEDIAVFRKAMGLDKPLYVQYLQFLLNIARGDLGTSYVIKKPAAALIAERMPATIQLAVAGMAVTLAIGIPLGVISAVKRYSWIDNVATIGGVVGQAMPLFWLGLMLIIIFGVKLRLLPISGRGTWLHLVLPAVSLGSYLAPVTLRLTRSGMLDVLTQDYIRTARAKGLSERIVLYKHALRNAAIPVVTIIGLQMGGLLNGAIVTETVFAWPGVASLTIRAIRVGDYPLVQASVLIFAWIIVLANLLADVAVAYIDPRIRYD
ncbi:MAG: ABC transporter permease [Nitrospinota bacterium]|nr:MAG: ABC transporter permease [Nitrospinota bacterium]